MIKRTTVLCIFALAASNAGAAGIHKWVDDNGVVQYGDHPPAKTETEKLGHAVAPKPPPVREPASEAELDDAVQKRDLERVRELTRTGTEVSQAASRMAAENNEPEILALLLAAREQKMASWASQSSLEYTMSVYRDTAMRQAVGVDADRVVEYLANEGTEADQGSWSSYLMDAVRGGFARTATVLLNAGADVDHRYGFALRHAAATGDVTMVKLLVDAGANVNAQAWGQSPPGPPIKDATNRGHTEVVEFLKAHGAE